MLHYLQRFRQARPRTAWLLLFLVLLLGSGAGFYLYALYQWHEVQEAMKENRYPEARSRLNVCLLVWPRSVDVHLAAARVARMNGDFAGAENHLHRCLKLGKDRSADVELEFLLMRVQLGQLDEVAGPLLECVKQDNPQSALILSTLAQAYLRDLRYGPAQYCLETWIERDPYADEAYYLRGWLHERLSDLGGSVQDFEKTLELNPDHDRARLRLVELDLHSRNAEAAEKHLAPLVKKSPDRPEVMARLGQCRFLQGDLDEARRLMEAAAQQMPDDLPLLTALGRLEMEAEPPNPQRAEHWLRQAIKIDWTDPDCHVLLISCLQAQNRKEEADAALEKYREVQAIVKRVNQVLQDDGKEPITDPNALYEVGKVFMMNKQERLGEYWLRQARKLDPQHQPTLKLLAGYYEKIGDRKQAEECRQALSHAPAQTSAAPPAPAPAR